MCFATPVVLGGHRKVGRGPGRSAARSALVLCLLGFAVLVVACGSPTANSTGSSGTGLAVAYGPPVPSSGCASAPQAPVTEADRTVEVGGVDRTYLLTTPALTAAGPRVGGRKTPAGPALRSAVARPLVLDFHGLGEGARLEAQTTQFGPLGQKDGFVVVFPNGTGTPISWDTSPGPHNADLAYVTALLAQVESTLCIDTSRVYATGFSDGALMASLLACTMSTRFAAVGPVSGLALPTPCRPRRAIPIVTFHGTADPILYFNGGVGTAFLNHLFEGGPPPPTTTTLPPKLDGSGVPATVNEWAKKNGCGSHFTDTTLGTQVILRTYPCPSRTGVDFYIVLGGGHAWPGSAFSRSITSVTGFTTFQVDATLRIWDFFRHFQL